MLLSNTFRVLQSFASEAIRKGLEPGRVCRSLGALLLSRNNAEALSPTIIGAYLGERRIDDGGWSDPEETAWATAVLSQLSGEDKGMGRRGKDWLEKVRHPGGGWGKHPRDQVRIPTTALVIALVPSVATDADREWVRQAWEKDMASPVQLSYKGGFYLLTVKNGSSKTIDPLVTRTIAYLAKDQNDDGGFGPWKNHPIGSDPWSTGVVLWGLSKWIDRVDTQVITRALEWLEKTQLPSGYWPYHYIDEGTSYALIGAVSAIRAMEGRK